MLKAIGKFKGRDTLFIGLSFGNLDKFRAQPLDTFVNIKGTEVGMPFDVMIFSGKTEADMANMITNSTGFGPDTKVHVSPKLKS
jgi:hypothetical protein